MSTLSSNFVSATISRVSSKSTTAKAFRRLRPQSVHKLKFLGGRR